VARIDLFAATLANEIAAAAGESLF